MCVCTYLDILVCVWNGRGYCTEKLLKEVFINATFIDHNNIRNLGTTTSQIFLYQVNDFFWFDRVGHRQLHYYSVVVIDDYFLVSISKYIAHFEI